MVHKKGASRGTRGRRTGVALAVSLALALLGGHLGSARAELPPPDLRAAA